MHGSARDSEKETVKRLIPPVLLDLTRKLRGMERCIWEGVYNNYADVPKGNTYESGSILELFTENLLALREKGITEPESVSDSMPLALLAAALSDARKIRILDYGGGLGISYQYLLRSNLPKDRFEYHIVEQKQVCEAGSKLFTSADPIQFHTDCGQVTDPVDIAYMNGALQYFEDYAAALADLAKLGPRFIALVRVTTVDRPTFLSRQKNLFDGANWFINTAELVKLVEEKGYSLVYHGPAAKDYDQTNFAPEYRMPNGRMGIFVFRKI